MKPRASDLVLDQQPKWPWIARFSVAASGFLAPAIALVLLANAGVLSPQSAIASSLVAVGMMGAGMIGASSSGRMLIGVLLAALSGTLLLCLALSLGAPMSASPLFALVTASIIMAIASFSFAARGALFARSAREYGWLIAIFVVGGEAAIIATAAISPGLLPDWLLVLLPAQWANLAIQWSISGGSALTAGSALIALCGTGLATLFVKQMWPRRWTYLVMFTTWLALSAVVWHAVNTTLPMP